MKTLARSAPAFTLVLGLALAGTAHAGSPDAWAAAKANLPKDTTVLVGLDLAQLSKSSLWGLGMPLVLSQQPDLKDALDTIKSSCGLDVMKVVQAVVIGTDDEQKHGAVFVAVNGVDPAKLGTCFQAVAKAKGKDAAAAVKVDGKITELAVGDKSVFVTWPAPSVIAFSIDPSNKTDLAGWTGGAKGLAKSKVARGMSKVATGAAAWAVSGVPKEVGDGKKFKSGYTAVKMSNGDLGVDLHLQFASAAEAKAMADRVLKDITTMAQGDVDESVKTVLKGVSVTSAADETVVKATAPEATVLQLVMALK